ncbi:lysophospholipid acyltransferase family protein [Calditrichota bacterium]
MNPLQMKLEYFAVAGFSALFRIMPYWLVRLKATFLGWFAARVVKFRKSVAMDNLHHAFPGKSAQELERVYLNCWQHFMRVGAELARLPLLNRDNIERYVDVSAHPLMGKLLERGKGILVASGHIGNWEILGAAMSAMGYPITYVVTNQSNKRVEEWIDRMRQSLGIEIIPRREAVKGVLNALKRNRVIAVLCDQDAGDAGVFVEFFGRKASTPRGPALFHLKTGAPILYVTCLYQRGGRYKIDLEEIKVPELTEDREANIASIMQAVTIRLEQDVRSHPEQWLWLHRRWKTEFIQPES